MDERYSEGKAEGRAEGFSDGEVSGIEKRNVEIAIKMLKANNPMGEISEFTGLSQDDILKIKYKLEFIFYF